MINYGIYKDKNFEADMRDHLDKLEMYKYELELARKEKDKEDIDAFALCMLQESDSIRDLVLWSDIDYNFSRKYNRKYKMMGI